MIQLRYVLLLAIFKGFMTGIIEEHKNVLKPYDEYNKFMHVGKHQRRVVRHTTNLFLVDKIKLNYSI